METLDKPTLAPIETGEFFKTFLINGKKGAEMPTHYATKEAVVIVNEGAITLNIDGKEKGYKTGESFIIPEGKHHSLKILEDFKATAVFKIDSEIKFN